MMFCYPAAGLAVVHKIGWKDGKKFFFASFVPMLTGITESFDFIFVFVSPLLFIFNSLMVGLAFMLLNITHTHVWLSSGWFVDIILFGILPQLNHQATNWWFIPIVGIVLSIPYYVVFYVNGTKIPK
jgi:PTS system D-glucosamine-specific IIC component